MDSLNRFYILKTIQSNDSTLLIINKDSKQLKNLDFNNSSDYLTLKTYKIYDIISPSNAIYCHNIDNIEIWCEDQDLDLHFTDSMGNEYFEKPK
tara:strand:- start:683 stop:964 length:282 start_codon:yes stop_codon:yes gene_type:complete